jgi:rhodanese-related sulfurtransferase
MTEETAVLRAETTVTCLGEDEEEADVQDDDEEDPVTLGRGEWTPDFHWVTAHVAVGGCVPMEHAARLAREHGIGAIVDLREEDRDDADLLRHAGIDFLHLPTPDLEPASIDMLERGVEFVASRIDEGKRVLIHCQHGIGRSALLALCVLVDEGWEPLDALKHAKDQRWVVSPSRSQYDGWAAWLASRGKAAPDYHTFGCIAYRHLANG